MNVPSAGIALEMSWNRECCMIDEDCHDALAAVEEMVVVVVVVLLLAVLLVVVDIVVDVVEAFMLALPGGREEMGRV